MKLPANEAMRRPYSIGAIAVYDFESSDPIAGKIASGRTDSQQTYSVERDVIAIAFTKEGIQTFLHRPKAAQYVRTFQGSLPKAPLRIPKMMLIQAGAYSCDSSGNDLIPPSRQEPLSLPGESISIKEQGSTYIQQNFTSHISKSYLNLAY
jgi:hypothetical protein